MYVRVAAECMRQNLLAADRVRPNKIPYFASVCLSKPKNLAKLHQKAIRAFYHIEIFQREFWKQLNFFVDMVALMLSELMTFDCSEQKSESIHQNYFFVLPNIEQKLKFYKLFNRKIMRLFRNIHIANRISFSNAKNRANLVI